MQDEPKRPSVFMIKPKRPISSFFMYKSERYKEIVAQNPQLKIAEITKMISEEWASTVDSSKKEEYKKKYASDKEKYLRDIEAYRKWKIDNSNDQNVIYKVGIFFVICLKIDG